MCADGENKFVNADGMELCVRCGKVTRYHKDVPIEERCGYHPGAGQLCLECNDEIYKVDPLANMGPAVLAEMARQSLLC